MIVSENYKRPQVAFKLKANGHCLNLPSTEEISRDYWKSIEALLRTTEDHNKRLYTMTNWNLLVSVQGPLAQNVEMYQLPFV